MSLGSRKRFISKPIVRGRFSHSVKDDLLALTFACFRTPNKNVLVQYEEIMAHYVRVRHCASFSLARTALWALLVSLNYPKGTRILMPSISIKAMVDVIEELGLEPVFVDVDLKSGCVDLDSLRRSLALQPKIILLTYLFGVVPNMDELMQILRSASIFIIEDFSQCLNGEFQGQKIGTFGDASILSTSSIKTLDTYGGGLLFTNNTQLFVQIQSIRNSLPETKRLRVVRKILVSFIKNVLTSTFIFYAIFPLIWVSTIFGTEAFSRFVGKRSASRLEEFPLAWLEKLSPIQAHFGLSYVKRVRTLDVSRAGIVHQYSQKVEFVGSKSPSNAKSVFWQCVVIAKNPSTFRKSLVSQNIDSARTSLTLLSVLPEYGWDYRINTPNALKLYTQGVYVPCYSSLDKRSIRRIAGVLEQLQQAGEIEQIF